MAITKGICKTIKGFDLIYDKDLLILFHDGTGIIVYDSQDFYDKLIETNGNGSIGTIWRQEIKESGRDMIELSKEEVEKYVSII